MNRRMRVAAMTAIVIAIGSGCDSDSSPAGPPAAEPVSPGTGQGGDAVELGLEDKPAGTIVDRIDLGSDTGSVAVRGRAVTPEGDERNRAIVFDSSNPTGGDFDLGTPNETFGGPGVGEGGERGQPFENDRPLGNLLIVGQDLVDADGDGLVDDPNDVTSSGNTLAFDFSGTKNGAVTVSTITIVDFERQSERARVELFGAGDAIRAAFTLPAVGDNGVGTFLLGPTTGVTRMVLILNGSGAIDEITVTP